MKIELTVKQTSLADFRQGNQNRTIQDILSQYKTVAELSREFDIPYKTIQRWIGGTAAPPQYVVDMIAYITFVVKSNNSIVI